MGGIDYPQAVLSPQCLWMIQTVLSLEHGVYLARIFVEACEDHMFEILPDAAMALLRYAIKVIQYHTFVFLLHGLKPTTRKQSTSTP